MTVKTETNEFLMWESRMRRTRNWLWVQSSVRRQVMEKSEVATATAQRNSFYSTRLMFIAFAAVVAFWLTTVTLSNGIIYRWPVRVCILHESWSEVLTDVSHSAQTSPRHLVMRSYSCANEFTEDLSVGDVYAEMQNTRKTVLSFTNIQKEEKDG